MWLNEPVEIVENYRLQREVEEYTLILSGVPVKYRRQRHNAWTYYRYVGGNYAAAQALANTLAEDSTMSDIQLPAAGGGQYHVVAVKFVEGVWSNWTGA